MKAAISCRRQFAVSAAPAGNRVFLEIADVKDYWRVKLSGKELKGRGCEWPRRRRQGSRQCAAGYGLARPGSPGGALNGTLVVARAVPPAQDRRSFI
jgi:hypothetical protein